MKNVHFPSARRRLLPLRTLLGIIAGAMAFVVPDWTSAQERPAGTNAGIDAVVAQMILGIVSYVRWQPPLASYRVCLASDRKETHDLGDRLLAAGGRSISVQWLGSDSEQWSVECDVAYLGHMSGTQRKAVLEQTVGHSILTISSGDPLCSAGSLFCLDVIGNDVSLQVNLDSVARSDIRVNPKVLQLAQRKGPRS